MFFSAASPFSFTVLSIITELYAYIVHSPHGYQEPITSHIYGICACIWVISEGYCMLYLLPTARCASISKGT